MALVFTPSLLPIRWALRCVACRTVTMESGKLFCPKCGNGGTLSKVSLTVGENGILQAGLPKRFNIRGTKVCKPELHYSILQHTVFFCAQTSLVEFLIRSNIS